VVLIAGIGDVGKPHANMVTGYLSWVSCWVQHQQLAASWLDWNGSLITHHSSLITDAQHDWDTLPTLIFKSFDSRPAPQLLTPPSTAHLSCPSDTCFFFIFLLIPLAGQLINLHTLSQDHMSYKLYVLTSIMFPMILMNIPNNMK
jgi:hypothetical protein